VPFGIPPERARDDQWSGLRPADDSDDDRVELTTLGGDGITEKNVVHGT